MEASAARWFADLGMEDPLFFHQWEASQLDHFTTTQQIAAEFDQDLQQSLSSESCTNSFPNSYHPPPTATAAAAAAAVSNTFHSASAANSKPPERPKKALKTNSWDSCMTADRSPAAAAPDASSLTILSFGKPVSRKNESSLYSEFLAANVKPKEELEFSNAPHGLKRSYEAMSFHGVKKAASANSRPASHNQEHIIAERKRREKLSQRFIALSAIVPGLKKMDKASVLGDAIKYLKQLQERVETLEEQATKRTVESAVLVKKSRYSPDDDDDDSSSCDESSGDHQHGQQSLPEIEAKISEKAVLIKIHCENRKGVLVKALSEIERLHLSIVSTGVVPFANSSLDITVMAQVEEEFSLTVKDLVKKLNMAFKQFM